MPGKRRQGFPGYSRVSKGGRLSRIWDLLLFGQDNNASVQFARTQESCCSLPEHMRRRSFWVLMPTHTDSANVPLVVWPFSQSLGLILSTCRRSLIPGTRKGKGKGEKKKKKSRNLCRADTKMWATRAQQISSCCCRSVGRSGA